jgi:hypothetical protein
MSCIEIHLTPVAMGTAQSILLLVVLYQETPHIVASTTNTRFERRVFPLIPKAIEAFSMTFSLLVMI